MYSRYDCFLVEDTDGLFLSFELGVDGFVVVEKQFRPPLEDD